MDVLTLLTDDHDRARDLFRRYRGGGGLTGLVKRVTGAVEARQQRDALKKVCDELDVHAQVEEEIFYPAVRGTGDPELAKLVEEGLREHATAKRRIAALRARADEAENLATEVDELESCVEHHASEEENEMFPRLERVMPDDRRAALAREVRARKKALVPRAGAAAGRPTGSRRVTARGRTAGTSAKTPSRARTTRAKRARARKTRGRARKRA